MDNLESQTEGNGDSFSNLEESEKKEEETFIKPQFIEPINKKNSVKSLLITDTNDNSSKFKKDFHKSPAQKAAEREIPLPYKEPSWSSLPLINYQFEVIKNGVIVENVLINKSYLVVGRLSSCDIIFEHPSISRFHCVIQYGSFNAEETGLYAYDLDSTHGTFQNKRRLDAETYSRIRVGHIMKFGGSTRLFVLQGPSEDQESETKETVTELKAIAAAKKKKIDSLEAKKEGHLDKAKDHKDGGINWGMTEDAIESDSDSDSESDGASQLRRPTELSQMTEMLEDRLGDGDLQLKDPKKTLRGWFERRGYTDQPQYTITEIKPAYFRAAVILPLTTEDGLKADDDLKVEVEHNGRKKDAVVLVAAQACRALDEKGLLRTATLQSFHARRRKNENADSGSDSDDFYDRTGDVDRKKRKRQQFTSQPQAETYESLSKTYEGITSRLDNVETLLKSEDEKRAIASSSALSEEREDSLDTFMRSLSETKTDKYKVLQWKQERLRMLKEESKVRALLNIAVPFGVEAKGERVSLWKSQTKADASNKTAKTEVTSAMAGKHQIGKVGIVHMAFIDDDNLVSKKSKFAKLNPPSSKTLNKITTSTNKGTPDESAPASDDIAEFKSPIKNNPTEDNTKEHNDSSELCLASTTPDIPLIEETETTQQTNLPLSDEEICVSEKLMANYSAKEEKRESDASPPIIKGPMLPPSNYLGKMLKAPSRPRSGDFDEPCEWTPPQGQTGDGKTKLNEKFGY